MSKHKSNPSSKPQNPPISQKKTEKTAVVKSEKTDPKIYFWGLAAAFLGFVLYANTLGHDYCLDDFASIKDNLIVKGGLKNVGKIFNSEYRAGAWNAPGSLYRPFTLAMFAWEWQISPDNAFLGHLINVILYAFTGWLMFITLRRVLAAWPMALAGAITIIFMVHPAHSEVVSNIKSRDEIVMFLGMLGAIYGLWRSFSGSNLWLLVAILSYTVGIFSKESSVTFLAIIPLAMYFFTDKNWGEIFKKTIIFLVPTVIFLVIRQSVLGNQRGKEATSPLDNFILASPNLVEQKASAFMVVTKYFQTLLAPFNLVSEIGYSQYRPVGFGDWRALLGLAIILGLVGLFFWGFLKKNPLAFAAAWFLATFSIVSNILITIGTSYGERLLYVPSLGFAIGIGFLIYKLLKINELNQKNKLFLGLLGSIALLFGALTFNRNAAWKDSFTLYETDIKTVPNSAKLNYHYGLELVKKGAPDAVEAVKDSTLIYAAIEHYSKAIEIWPTYRDAFAGRGLAYFRLKKYNIAFKDYESALKYDPNDAKVLSNMGYIYFIFNDMKSAEDVYRRAVKADPRFVDAWRNLGATMAMQKRYSEAIPAWQEALKVIPPNDPTMRMQKATLNHYIYMSYRDSGQKELGEPYYLQAAAIDPKLPR